MIEYSKNYKKTTGSSWNYYRDEPDNDGIRNSESFKYKTSITGNTANNNNNTITDAETVVPLKDLSIFWRSLSIPLINCKVSLALTRSKSCVLTHSAVVLVAQGNNPAITHPKNPTFRITDTKLYVLIVTLSKENDKKLLEQLKSGFKRTVKWNKYRSQMTIQSNNNNLNYLIDLIFTKVNSLFVLSFKEIKENNFKKDHRDSFSHYYVPNIEIKKLNVLIDRKSFFDLLVKMKKKLT